jgi:hypothetical protein
VPQPPKGRPRFTVMPAIDTVLRVIAHASAQPMGPGPRGVRDGLH